MNIKRLLIQLAIALGLAVVTGYLAINWMESRSREGVKEVKVRRTVPVVIAKVVIPPGTLINKNMILVKEFLLENKPKSAFESEEEVLGRVTIYAINPTEIITTTLLASSDVTTSGVGALVTPGKRAMAVKGNKVLGLSGLIRPGDIVDVLVSFRQKDKNITKIVLENLKVLATGKELYAGTDGAEASPVDVYTLEVTPEEGEVLALAATNGTIHFALRHKSDGETVLTEGADEEKTLASYRGTTADPKKEAVTPPAKDPYDVEILRGNTLQNVRLE